jgi:hypothetical protein
VVAPRRSRSSIVVRDFRELEVAVRAAHELERAARERARRLVVARRHRREAEGAGGHEAERGADEVLMTDAALGWTRAD